MSNVLLVGNPNVGKTTIFNKLTKSFEHTGNWHGVTVDSKSKLVKYNNNNKINIIDLPGLYNLSSYSFEEEVSVSNIYNNVNSTILNICNCNQLAKNLYLTLNLLELGLKPILVLNLYSEAQKNSIYINKVNLSKNLNLQVVDSKNLNLNYIFQLNKIDETSNNNLPYLKNLPLEQVKQIVGSNFNNLKTLNTTYVSIKILEDDKKIIESLNLSKEQKNKLDALKKQDNYKHLIARLRFNYINTILQNCVTVKKTNFIYGKSKLDRIILNKYLCIPIFVLLMCLIFYLTFSSVGGYLSNIFKKIIDKLFEPLLNYMVQKKFSPFFVNLFYSSVVCGVGGILSFIPQIVLLFLFLAVLEDSGYMSRVAFFMEDILSSFGLSGKSIYTIIMSFGCSTSAVLTARTIEDKNTKIKTAIMCPYLSCSAKLPIYAVVCGAFFSKNNFLIIVLLYILGVFIALIIALLLNKTTFKSGEKSFILELPPYRALSYKRLIKVTYENCKTFIIKVATIILSFNVIVFILQNCNFKLMYIHNLSTQKSILQTICEFLAPIFKPIGLNNWGIVACLLVGVMAKEMVVSTMAIINKIPNSANFENDLSLSLMAGSFVISFTQTSSIIFMIFSLLYLPCISTMGVMNKEIGIKNTLLACIFQFAICYLICFILYNFLISNFIIKVLIVFGVIFLSIFLIKKQHKTKMCMIGKCANCYYNCTRF